MILAMYWQDDEPHKKQRVIEGQKQKKSKGKADQEYEVVSLEDYSQVVEEIKKQNDLIAKQQQMIGGLHVLLVNLTNTVENQSGGTTIIYQESQEIQPKNKSIEEDGMPVLEPLDVEVINTEGFETRGQVGEQRKKGTSIQDKLKRFKELKKTKQGENNE